MTPAQHRDALNRRMEMTRDQAASAIKNAKSIYDLIDALIAFEDTVDRWNDDMEHAMSAYDIDICELPTFGGTEPASTDGVWSWDANALLVGEGPFKDWEIRRRP